MEEKKTENKPTTEDEMKATLLAFKREAEGAIQAFRAITVDIEKRLTERVQVRAVEQSKAMQGLGERIDRIDSVLQSHGTELRKREEDIKQIDHALDDHKEFLDGQSKVMFEIEATAKKINENAGARFGEKLEAMGTQVAKLTTIGERLAQAEKTGKQAIDDLARFIEIVNPWMDEQDKKLLDAGKTM